MVLKKLFVRYYIVITLLIVVMVVVGSYYFAIGPKYESVSIGGQYNYDTLLQQRDQRAKYLNDLKRLVHNYESISQDDITKLKKILPEAGNVADLFVQFQALAEKHHFRLLSINIDEQAKRPDKSDKLAVNQLNISLNLVGGGYPALKELLDSIESNIRIFDVNAIHFTADSSNYSINLFTYYFN